MLFGSNKAPVFKAPVFYSHYTWIIVAVIVLANMVGSSIRMAFGVLINPLEVNFNWDQTTITLAYAVSNVVTALFSPVAAWLSNRIGARKSMMVGTGILFTGMMS
ncbi:uncharacterized protein METZ01_LOCUS470402, partial [marine metagenome]